MKKWFIALGILIVLLIVFFAFRFETAKVVTNLPDNFKVGENFNADLIIRIEEGDSIFESTPILIDISKDGRILKEDTIRFGDFIALSDNVVSPTVKEGRGYFETVGAYKVNLGKIMPYTFTEKGEYELSFKIVSEGLDVRKEFLVE